MQENKAATSNHIAHIKPASNGAFPFETARFPSFAGPRFSIGT